MAHVCCFIAATGKFAKELQQGRDYIQHKESAAISRKLEWVGISHNIVAWCLHCINTVQRCRVELLTVRHWNCQWRVVRKVDNVKYYIYKNSSLNISPHSWCVKYLEHILTVTSINLLVNLGITATPITHFGVQNVLTHPVTLRTSNVIFIT